MTGVVYHRENCWSVKNSSGLLLDSGIIKNVYTSPVCVEGFGQRRPDLVADINNAEDNDVLLVQWLDRKDVFFGGSSGLFPSSRS